MKKRECAIIFTLGLVILSLGVVLSLGTAGFVGTNIEIPNPGHSIWEIAPPISSNTLMPSNPVLGWDTEDKAWEFVSMSSGGGDSFWESVTFGILYNGQVEGKHNNGHYGKLGSKSYGIYGRNNNENFGYFGGASYGSYGANNNGNFGWLGSASYGAFGKHESSNNRGYLGGEDYGAYGVNDNGNSGYIGGTTFGIKGFSESGKGVYGRSLTGYAGYFSGDVKVTGDLIYLKMLK